MTEADHDHRVAEPGSHEHHDGGHDHHAMGNVNSMAVSATLHCLTGCAIGEIIGLVIGTAAGLGNVATIAISIALAFLFGYTLSTLPLLKAGLPVGTALSVVLAADTLSIATMEVVDNVVVAIIPGAMNAGLVNVVFWLSLLASLTIAFFAAYPVNRYLLQRGKGHALTHEYHGASARTQGLRRFIPTFGTGALVATIIAFILGGLLVSIAEEVGGRASSDTHAAVATPPGGDREGTSAIFVWSPERHVGVDHAVIARAIDG
jgi:hypothetical protein